MRDSGAHNEEPAEPSELQGQIIMQPEQMAGAWANVARVSHTEHDSTSDFVRLDFAGTPVNGIVVARVAVSQLFVTQFIEASVELGRVREERRSSGRFR